MKVVLDANVWIAAFATRGLCADIARFAITSCIVIGSEELLKECEKTLIKKLKLPRKRADNIISYLRTQLHIIEPMPIDASQCRDVNDLHVLGIALGSKAKFIVTGDKDLLTLKQYRGTKIYTPRQFWTYIQSLQRV